MKTNSIAHGKPFYKKIVFMTLVFLMLVACFILKFNYADSAESNSNENWIQIASRITKNFPLFFVLSAIIFTLKKAMDKC
jgi:NADH:ubiquinone oxidoreductase subunit 6 (subunit J)